MARPRKAKKSWSYQAGKRGRNRVRAYKDSKSGVILLEFYEVDTLGRRTRKRVSTGHQDEAQAESQADQLAAALLEAPAPDDSPTLRVLFDIYLREVTPQKSASTRAHDRSCAEMFLRFFGNGQRADTLDRRDWDRFIQERRRGAIGPAGRDGKFFGDVARRRQVGDRQIGYDLEFLQAVLNWATVAGRGSAGAFLARNPCKGFPRPKEKNPKRPMLTDEQYARMTAAASEMDWRFGLALVLAYETGHRNQSIRNLRWHDVDLDGGMVRWDPEFSKTKTGGTTPLTAVAIDALRRARREHASIGGAWIFPSPEDSSVPCSRHLMRDWWDTAQERSGIESHDDTGAPTRLGWHSCRRKFATDMLDQDVALRTISDLGGWKEPMTVVRVYQKSTGDQQRRALEQRRGARAASS